MNDFGRWLGWWIAKIHHWLRCKWRGECYPTCTEFCESTPLFEFKCKKCGKDFKGFKL